MKIKCLAIDDEPLALLQLRTMIEKTPFFQLVGACQDAFEAMKVLEKENVDTIFCDINMPDLNGLDFVRSLAEPPLIVFTTAYSQYAIDGFKVNALDYLLKPFGQPEFQRVAMKVKKQYELMHHISGGDTDKVTEDVNTESISISGDILFVKVDYRIVRVSVPEIEYIEAQSEYFKIHIKDGQSLMVLMSIKRMTELLPKDKFVRIHRSYIVNMNYVKEIARMRINMGSGVVLPIGDSYKEDTLKYIHDRLIGKD